MILRMVLCQADSGSEVTIFLHSRSHSPIKSEGTKVLDYCFSLPKAMDSHSVLNEIATSIQMMGQWQLLHMYETNMAFHIEKQVIAPQHYVSQNRFKLNQFKNFCLPQQLS